MQARFLCGPAGSGKSFRCLAEVRNALQTAPDGLPLIFIAPKQATFQLERQLLGDGAIKGFTRLRILSFERLAGFVFDKLKVAPPKLLSDEGRVMVLRALLLRHEIEQKLFRGSARRAGFAREISGLLAEFQQHRLSPTQLRALAANDSLRLELREKLRDLALLHEEYAGWLAHHHLEDGNRLLGAAAELLRSHSGHTGLQFSALWLDGFAEMTPQELDLLAAILRFCNEATLAFCVDERAENSWLSIWNAVGKTFHQCRQRLDALPECRTEVIRLPRDPERSRFGRSPVLRELEMRWESGGRQILRGHDTEATVAPPPSGVPAEALASSLRVIACENPETEVIFAAREIWKFVRAGNRFRDCAVLVRNLESYHKPLARTFQRYGIPFFLDRREGVAHHPLAELTRSALRTVAFEWQHEDWFAALKTGFCAAAETEIDRLENEALARGWRGGRWREPLHIPDEPELGDRMEKLRRDVLPPFERFHDALSEVSFKPTGQELAGFLRELWATLNVEKTLEQRSLEQGPQTVADRRQPSIHGTVWEQMKLWLDNVELAFANVPLPLRDWLPVLDSGLANLTVGIIPPTLDEVLAGAVDRARNPELKFCIVLGVNETLFPAAPISSAILTDADRDELNQMVSLGGDLRQRLARERYYGYIAFTRAAERLAVTFSRTDAGGRPLNASAFVTRLEHLFPQCEVENFDGQIPPDEIATANELVPMLAGSATSSAFEGWRRSLASSPKIAAVMDQLNRLREPEPTENLLPAIAGSLYGAVLRTSVSRLEEFAQCPFKFFIRSGLRAGERKLFELDARERGTFQHDVLKSFHEELVAENKRWRDLTAAEARERVGRIAAGLAGEFREGLLRDSPQTRFAARLMTESLQDFVEVIVSWMHSQYQFDPAAVELEFGGDGPMPAWELELEGGRRLALRGRIDRIDLCRDSEKNEALAVVLDYKSSSKKLEAVLMEHGVQLQLAAYLNALQYLKDPRCLFGVEKLVPAGVFYVNLRGQFENGKTRLEILAAADEARRAAYRHAGRFDAGALGKLDSAGAADQFNYRLNQDGLFRKRSGDAIAREEFEGLLDLVEEQLKRIGNEIFSGTARVDPYRRSRETPCAFCDYRAVCRIDPWTHRYRALVGRKTD